MDHPAKRRPHRPRRPHPLRRPRRRTHPRQSGPHHRRRARRTARDLPNAALSYGYAILLSECVGALHATGLEPSLDIAHAPTDKRPSLALDLMEQFRPLLVDQTSWRSCARANSGPNTASSSTRSGECGWAPTARKSSSTRTRSPASDPSPAPCPDTRDRGAATSPTPRRCWRASARL